MARLRWLRRLHLRWPGEPLGAAMPRDWLRPGVWQHLERWAAAAGVTCSTQLLPC